METLNICFVSTNTYPSPPPTYGGEVVWYDLCRSLDEMGHKVLFIAPPGSWQPPNGEWVPMQCSYGTSVPWFWECEQAAWGRYKPKILGADVIHDGSHTKKIAENLYNAEMRTNCVSTLLGGVWSHPAPPYNIVVWSEAMRQRGIRGAGDYENSPLKNMDSYTGKIKDARVVPGACDTDFYCPGEEKGDELLWLNRWHPAKGYHLAIELAKQRPDLKIVMAGLHPDQTWSPDHTASALDAMQRAKGVPNIRFEFLPKLPPELHHQKKRALFRHAKALLYLVQFQEPFGLAQVEGMACGTPLIATRYGSIPEVVEDGKTGIVCGDSIEELSKAADEVGRIRPEDCRKSAVERFDRRVMARNYLALYRRVMNGETWGL